MCILSHWLYFIFYGWHQLLLFFLLLVFCLQFGFFILFDLFGVFIFRDWSGSQLPKCLKSLIFVIFRSHILFFLSFLLFRNACNTFCNFHISCLLFTKLFYNFFLRCQFSICSYSCHYNFITMTFSLVILSVKPEVYYKLSFSFHFHICWAVFSLSSFSLSPPLSSLFLFLPYSSLFYSRLSLSPFLHFSPFYLL